MNMRRVVALNYRVVVGSDTDFDTAPPLDVSTPEFAGRLESGTLVLRPLHDFDTEDLARAAASAFIRSWEIAAGLRYASPSEFQFRYVGAEIEDLGTPPGVVSMSVSSSAHVTAEASAHVSRGSYPPPPASSELTPEIEAIWARISRYLEGREPLTSTAYFVYTALKQDSGGMIDRYRITQRFLKKISEISSTRGDHLTARKHSNSLSPLSAEDQQWLHDALLRIMKQLLTAEADRPILDI